MTRTVQNYLDLLPSASIDKAKFVATLSALLQPFVDAQGTADGMPTAFDIDSAVGPQLDAVGVRVGLSRVLAVPIAGVYFSIDVAGLGLDQGVIQGAGDPNDALTSLDDETYRAVLKLKVGANKWDGTLAQAQQFLSNLAGAGTYIFMQDNFDMTVTIGISGIVPSRLFVSLLTQMASWIKPATVAISAIIVTSENGAPIFGIDVENNYIAGLDTGAIGIIY